MRGAFEAVASYMGTRTLLYSLRRKAY
jgi:hypothetical protein